jgi:hypothetical protein
MYSSQDKETRPMSEWASGWLALESCCGIRLKSQRSEVPYNKARGEMKVLKKQGLEE